MVGILSRFLFGWPIFRCELLVLGSHPPKINIEPECDGLEDEHFPYFQGFILRFHVNLPGCTLPKTNSSHLKMDGWNTFSFPFGMAYFQGRTVSFRESPPKKQHRTPPSENGFMELKYHPFRR